MVIDLPELNPFHFSNLLGKPIASGSFEDANAYGTFIDDAGGSSAPTTTSSYPYALGSREPTVIVLGMLESDFTCLGLCCAIVFFPLGILCCLAFRQRRCHFCGAIF
jgi:hypothetical protein